MLQPNLIRRVEDALRAINNATPISEVLDSLEGMNRDVDAQLLAIAEGHNVGVSANELHSKLSSLPAITRALNTRQLFATIEKLRNSLDLALGEGVKDRSYVVVVLTALDHFGDAYNQYITHQSGANAVPLLLVSRRLREALGSLRALFEYIQLNNGSAGHIRDGESEFSLVLVSVVGLNGYAEKLQALEALYSELCYVLSVSISSHPLRVDKIQSGSLWTRLFGDTRVVGLMVDLMQRSVEYFHRNYTKEGKIAAIPKKIESLDAILDLSNRLKNCGVDVSTLEGSLAKNAATISNHLNTLLADQPVVEVNGRVMSLGKEMEKALLEHTATLKLTHTHHSDTLLAPNQPDVGS